MKGSPRVLISYQSPLYCIFDLGSPSVAQAGFDLMSVSLPQPTRFLVGREGVNIQIMRDCKHLEQST